RAAHLRPGPPDPRAALPGGRAGAEPDCGRRAEPVRRGVHCGGYCVGSWPALPRSSRVGHHRRAGSAGRAAGGRMDVSPPLGLLAELTHRCPLHCPYCSNPVELVGGRDELGTAVWLSVLSQARELGVLQVHMSGGEPLARHDLVDLVARASDLGCYVNLVTSGLGLTERKLARLVDAGIAHVQLSVQGADTGLADQIAGTTAHARKLAAA